jgi:hypothetical protein
VRFDALGQADQAFARSSSAWGASTLRKALEGSATKHQVAGVQGGQQVVDRLDPGCRRCP